MLLPQQDIINKDRCKEDPFPGCSALEHIAPIYFAIFVLCTQFVLLNVVVAVLMKHLEDAKEEISVNSSRDGEVNTLEMQTDGGQIIPDTAQDISKAGDYYRTQKESVPIAGSNNNTMTVIPAVGSVRQTNDSESSLSSFEYAPNPLRLSADSRYRLPPVDQPQCDRSASLATLRLPPIGSQSSGLNKMVKSAEKIDDPALSGLPSTENEKPVTPRNDGSISPRAPIYVMSEDSDMYDSNMEVDRDRSKVFRPVDRSPAARSPSPHSSSEDEGKKKSFFKKPHHKSDTKKPKSAKMEPKSKASVSPRHDTKPDKQEPKPVKPDAQWASPVSGSTRGQEIKLRTTLKPENDEDKDKTFHMQSYV